MISVNAKSLFGEAQARFSEEKYDLPDGYVDQIRGLSAQALESSSKLLSNDYFFRRSFQVAYQNGFSSYPGVRNRLYPLAQKLWKEKDAFEKGVLRGENDEGLVPKLQCYIANHDSFALQFTVEAMSLNSNAPFVFQQDYPKTVAHFKKTFSESYKQMSSKKREEIKQELECSSEQIIQVIVDLGILSFLKESNLVIELIPREGEIPELSDLLANLNEEEFKSLENKILQEADLQEGTRALTVYKRIVEVRSRLERTHFNSLVHTLFLECSSMLD